MKNQLEKAIQDGIPQFCSILKENQAQDAPETPQEAPRKDFASVFGACGLLPLFLVPPLLSFSPKVNLSPSKATTLQISGE